MYYKTMLTTANILKTNLDENTEYTAKQIKEILSATSDKTMSIKNLRAFGILKKVREECFEKKLDEGHSCEVLVDNKGNEIGLEVFTYNFMSANERAVINNAFNNGKPLKKKSKTLDTIKVSRYFYKFDSKSMNKVLEKQRKILKADLPWKLTLMKNKLVELKSKVETYETILNEIEGK